MVPDDAWRQRGALPVPAAFLLATAVERLERRLAVSAEKEIYTTDEAASRLGRSGWTVRQLCNKGQIRAKKVRGKGRTGEWRIPPEAAGGEYTLTVSEAQNRFPPERRKFLVNQYQAPRLNKEVERAEKMLANERFVENAAPEVVEAEREKLERYRRELDALSA